MTVEAVREIISRHREELAEIGMGGLSVFGSVARGEAGPNSDVDLLVELNKRMGLFELPASSCGSRSCSAPRSTW